MRNKQAAAQKTGIEAHLHRLDENSAQEDLFRTIQALNADDAVDGILLQLTLPAKLSATPLLEAIDPRKDVDGLHPFNLGQLALGQPGLRPCTPKG